GRWLPIQASAGPADRRDVAIHLAGVLRLSSRYTCIGLVFTTSAASRNISIGQQFQYDCTRLFVFRQSKQTNT
ncbi:MAG TPA: hypothetical protein VGD52_07290, partial [Pseudoduganella sp.]